MSKKPVSTQQVISVRITSAFQKASYIFHLWVKHGTEIRYSEVITAWSSYIFFPPGIHGALVLQTQGEVLKGFSKTFWKFSLTLQYCVQQQAKLKETVTPEKLKARDFWEKKLLPDWRLKNQAKPLCLSVASVWFFFPESSSTIAQQLPHLSPVFTKKLETSRYCFCWTLQPHASMQDLRVLFAETHHQIQVEEKKRRRF